MNGQSNTRQISTTARARQDDPEPLEIPGRFLIWYPDTHPPFNHRLLDSDHEWLASRVSRRGSLILHAQTISLVKDRRVARILFIIILIPVWVALTIGLSLLVQFVSPDLANRHVDLILLLSTVIALSVCVLLIRRFIKPLVRQFLSSQIANVHLSHAQITRNHRPVNEGYLAVSFTIVPSALLNSSVDGTRSLTSADAGKCTFVTFMCQSESDARALKQWLPTHEVPLTGRINRDIPPQQNARWMQPDAKSAPQNPAPVKPAVQREQRYPHSLVATMPLIYAVLLGLASLSAACTAVTNHRGLVLNGLPLGPGGATVFYCLLAVFFGASALFSSAIALQRAINPHFLVLRPDGILLHAGWFKPKESFVSFTAIESVEQRQDVRGGHRTLVIHVQGGAHLVREHCFRNRRTFEEISATIARNQKNPPRAPTLAPARPPEPPPGDDSRYMPKG